MLKPIPLPGQAAVISERIVPHDFIAEQGFLGAVLLNNRAIYRALDFLKPDHFSEPMHGRLYQTLIKMIEIGQPVNASALHSIVANDPDLQAAGGQRYIAGLIGAAQTIIQATDYARLIFTLHMRRELIAMGERIVDEAFDPTSIDPGQMLTEAQDLIESVAREYGTVVGQKPGGLRPAEVFLDEAMEDAYATHNRPDDQVVGVSTGIPELDKALAGLVEGTYWILAGATGMGKSSLAQSICYNRAKQMAANQESGVIVYATPEMKGSQIMSRMLAYETGISQKQQRAGPLSKHEIRELEENHRNLRSSIGRILHIDDAPVRQVEQIGRRVRNILRRAPVKLIVVDYIQRIGGSAASAKNANKSQVIGDISKYLMDLGKDVGCPVIALSQLNRALEGRDDKRPTMADLRESGDLEQDADIVGLVYREHYYLSRGAAPRMTNEPHSPAGDEKYASRMADHDKRLKDTYGKAEINLAKVRHGNPGRVELSFDGPRQYFSTWEAGEIER